MTEDVELYEEGLYIWLDTDARGAEVMQVIRESGKLEKETEEKLKSALEAYTESFWIQEFKINKERRRNLWLQI